MRKIFITLLILLFLSIFSTNIHANGTIPTPQTHIKFTKSVSVVLRLALDIDKDQILDESDRLFYTIDWPYLLQYENDKGIIVYSFVGQLNKLEQYDIPVEKESVDVSITIFSPTGKTISFDTNYTKLFEGEYIYLDNSNAYYELNFTFSGTPESYLINNFEYINQEVPIGATITNPCTQNNVHLDCSNYILTDKFIGISDEYKLENYSFNLAYPDKKSSWRLSCSHASNPEIIQFNVIGSFNSIEYNFDYCLKNRKIFLPVIPTK